MRGFLRLAVVGLLAGLAGAAWAQEVGDPAPDFEIKDVQGDKDSREVKGKFLERQKNRLVLFVFWRSNDPESADMIKTLIGLSEKYFKRGVSFVLMTDQKKEKIDKAVSEALKEAAKSAKGSSLIWWMSGLDPDDGPYRFPGPGYAYIVDAHGLIAEARFRVKDQLEEKIKDVMAKTPPVGADPESLQKRLAQVTEFMAQEDWYHAYTLAAELKAFLKGEEESVRKRLDEPIKKIEEGAQKLLKQAREEAEAKNYESACRTLAELSIRFAGSTLKEEADQEIGRLQGDNYTKEFVRKALANAKGGLRNEDAAELEARGKYLEARDVYRNVVEEYEGSEAAKKAQEEIDHITSDPTVLEEIQKDQATQQAVRWYDLAERYAQLQMFEQARQMLEQLISEHPDSQYAEQARQRLDKLTAEEESAKTELEQRAADKAERQRRIEEVKKQQAEDEQKHPKDKDKKGSKPGKSGKPDKGGKPNEPKPKGGGGGGGEGGGGGGGGGAAGGGRRLIARPHAALIRATADRQRPAVPALSVSHASARSA